ncbi:MAG: DUF2807 domain-containing protein [Flavobacteriaceae bacterium]|jgi:hypothetical protein|nr:DUF2807 domain-containing protein [Flavobacteriaceae bacterium]
MKIKPLTHLILKSSLYTLFQFIVLVHFVVLANAQPQYSNDPLENPRFIKIESFNALKVYSGVIVNLIPSDTNKAVIYGDRYGGLVLKKKGNTLKLKIRLGEMIYYNNTYVDLYYKDSLNSLTLHQGAYVDSKRPIKTNKLLIKAHEGSEFEGEIIADQLFTKARTGGLLTLYGKVKKHQIQISTGGSCYAQDLITDHTSISVFAGGDAIVYSENLINAKVSMGGNIKINGNPKQVIAKRSFAGQIYSGSPYAETNRRNYKKRSYRNYN